MLPIDSTATTASSASSHFQPSAQGVAPRRRRRRLAGLGGFLFQHRHHGVGQGRDDENYAGHEE